ncbi:hypothetical protein BGZ96_012824 [Linnemannia gamsii]|uniref:Uncharacterized protein n=1 Tax=Linnemannia gamsii TaxID=64522 RepID=A0ABQ7JPM4_9FUNG|nr:hypothetical protein BGZ96_012824 [Linnemannia gamsii]
MHFTKTALLTVTLLAAALSSTVTAQWVEDASSACQSCLLTARNAQVPSCKDIPANPRGERDSKMPLAARICQCGAAESNAWIHSDKDSVATSTTSTVPTATDVSGSVAPAASTVAPSMTTSLSPAPTGNGSPSLLAKSSVAVAGMTFAAAGAFAALL